MRTINEILKMFPWTQKGDWNKHENGGGWVQITARADTSARIEGIVSGNAWVFGTARVSGNAWVFGTARVSGDAWVFGTAQVSGNARVSGDAWVFGTAQVSGNARVSGNAWVFGTARVSGDAWVSGDARVSGDAWDRSPLQIQGTMHFATNCKFGHISIGCEVHTFAEWKSNYKTIGAEHGYTDEQIKEYKAIIDLFCKIGR